MRSKCPDCGRFLAKVVATILSRGPDDSDQRVEKVEGVCRKHGTVETDDWCYEDFFPEGAQRQTRFRELERSPR